MVRGAGEVSRSASPCSLCSRGFWTEPRSAPGHRGSRAQARQPNDLANGLTRMGITRSGEPNILFLCANCPYGETYGGTIRARLVAEGLRLAGRVTIAPVSWYPWPERGLNCVKQHFAVTRQVLQEEQRRRLSSTILRNVSARFLNTDDRLVNAVDRKMIAELVRDADLIWIEDIGIANSLGTWRWKRAVLDADDLLSSYHVARSQHEHGAKRLRTLWQAGRWRRRELTFVRRFDRVVVCSEADHGALGSGRRVRVIPNSYEYSGPCVRKAAGSPRFGFIGTLQWEPNRDAVRWFARDVMPNILRLCPDAEFRVVGRNSVEFFEDERLPGTPLGYLEDATDEMAGWTAMVVPVRFGGGTRVKIAEAFARRIPVVSTSLGAFGYDVAHGGELMLADSAEEFANACAAIAMDASLGAGLAERAAACLKRNYSPHSVRDRVRMLACEVLAISCEQATHPLHQ